MYFRYFNIMIKSLSTKILMEAMILKFYRQPIGAGKF